METINLERNGIIQASAGTGKTHAIEGLVYRLIAEARVPLDRILVVTYTEKATGDLKTRLRSKLETEIARADGECRRLLQQALDDFDQAPISTIHGFCQRLLQEYPLEKGQDFAVRLVSDAEPLDEALRDVQRRGWPRTFGAGLIKALSWAGFEGEEAAAFETTVRNLARTYRPAWGHRLLPEEPDDWTALLASDEAPPNFHALLAAHTVRQTHQRLADLKRERGGQSFDDMLTSVRDALDPKQNPRAAALLALLRQRYHCGIVDEFQDTDQVQWDIFRRLFLESGGGNPLFVVGDPKQAIYGFRGADLPTYVQAVRMMETTYGAQVAVLPINWRSTPALIEALNRVFGQGGFFPGDDIAYHDVQAPRPEQRQVALASDTSGRPALTIVDVNEFERAAEARRHYADFITGEIVGLLSGAAGQPRLTVSRRGGEPRPLTAGDIAILCFRRKETVYLRERLSQAGIPWTFYKEGSLWDSEEAQQVKLLLDALCRPQELASFRLALLTKFFALSPVELAQADEIPLRHPARALFQRLAAAAQNQAWAELFGALVEETGLLAPKADDFKAERRLANYRALFAALRHTAYADNLDLPMLASWLAAKIAAAGNDDEQQPIDTEQAKVRILTVYAAKGLEFPVVFLAGGLTGNSRKQDTACYHDDANQTVFDLVGTDKERINSERLAEWRRLLYVALTRAMVKLYVPRLDNAKNVSASPVLSVLAPALAQSQPETLGGNIAARITHQRGLTLPSLATAGRPASAATPATPVTPMPAPTPLWLPIDPNLGKRRLVVRSFSSMRRATELTPEFGDEPVHHADEPVETLATPDVLRGPVFGDLIHDILERIDFVAVGQAAAPTDLFAAEAPTRPLLEQAVRRTLPKLRTRTPPAQLEAACLLQAAQLVWHALHTPLAEVGGPLWRIAPQARLTELPFHYPETLENPRSRAVLEDAFVTGFIDLVFQARGRWFLIDWKTNLLPDYTPADLARCMDESGYHQQRALYVEAVSRWLRRRAGRAGAPETIGGTYYLFVRGLNGKDESRGVAFHRGA
jgi:exodeoxyribonuclease V beta subunit